MQTQACLSVGAEHAQEGSTHSMLTQGECWTRMQHPESKELDIIKFYIF